MKSYWLETTGSIEKGVGFSHFSTLHIGWLVCFVLFTGAMCMIYRRRKAQGRQRLRGIIAAAIVADEIFKMAVLFIGGHYTKNYLPLHLCSINIFLIAYHARRPGRVLDNFLYAVCVPGAIAALLLPGWTKLPLANLMHIHSFTIHILLAAYPIMLLAGGDIRPEAKYIPKCLGVLAGFAVVALIVNLVLDTNYMYLMYAPKGTPLYWFDQQFGNHLLGYLVLLPLILAAMYLPFSLRRKHVAASVPA